MQLMFTDLQKLLIAVSNGIMHTVCAFTEKSGEKSNYRILKKKKGACDHGSYCSLPLRHFFMRIDSNIDRS